MQTPFQSLIHHYEKKEKGGKGNGNIYSLITAYKLIIKSENNN